MVTMVGLRRSIRRLHARKSVPAPKPDTHDRTVARLCARTSTLAVAALGGALSAAVLEELVALSADAWSWAALAQHAPLRPAHQASQCAVARLHEEVGLVGKLDRIRHRWLRRSSRRGR